jgi:hypothetical protein
MRSARNHNRTDTRYLLLKMRDVREGPNLNKVSEYRQRGWPLGHERRFDSLSGRWRVISVGSDRSVLMSLSKNRPRPSRSAILAAWFEKQVALGVQARGSITRIVRARIAVDPSRWM